MLIIDSLYFSYNGETSESYGVYLVNVGTSGMKEEHFLGDKEIVQESVFGNDIPYVYGVNNKPLTISMTISPLEGLWTTSKRSEIARWLDCGKFAELYSMDDENKRYFAMLTGSSNLYTNSNQQGYINVEFQNISPFSYSPAQELIWDESDLLGSTPTTRVFPNLGDVRMFPEMYISKVGNGDFQIKNLNDSGRIFKFTDLLDGEVVYVDNYNRQITTSLEGEYRYSNFNGNYFSVVYGNNSVEISGAAEIKFVYRYVFKG